MSKKVWCQFIVVLVKGINIKRILLRDFIDTLFIILSCNVRVKHLCGK